MKALCKLYVECDCALMEVNPLVVTNGGELVSKATLAAWSTERVWQ